MTKNALSCARFTCSFCIILVAFVLHLQGNLSSGVISSFLYSFVIGYVFGKVMQML